MRIYSPTATYASTLSTRTVSAVSFTTRANTEQGIVAAIRRAIGVPNGALCGAKIASVAWTDARGAHVVNV